jgi:hypothetical protein
VSDKAWRAAYEKLRSDALAGALSDGEDARRLTRFGLAGLATTRPAWRVVMREATEPRWSGGDARLATLLSVYGRVVSDTTKGER